MLYAIQIHRIDQAREDVYLASAADQEAVIAESEDFHGRTVLRSQTEGVFWMIDAWTDREGMERSLAAARTLASVAALEEEPVQVLTEGEELASRPATGGDGADSLPLLLIAQNWVKEVCEQEYVDTVGRLGHELASEEGFRRRLLLRDLEHALRFFVVDWWESERAAYESYQRRQTTELEATRFLSLLAERGKPLIASGLQVQL